MFKIGDKVQLKDQSAYYGCWSVPLVVTAITYKPSNMDVICRTVETDPTGSFHWNAFQVSELEHINVMKKDKYMVEQYYVIVSGDDRIGTYESFASEQEAIDHLNENYGDDCYGSNDYIIAKIVRTVSKEVKFV